MNVRKGNFDDEVRVTWILVRTSTEPQRGQNEDQREHCLVEEYEDEAAERKATYLKHGSLSIGDGDYLIENVYSLPFLPLKAPRWHFFQLNTFSKDTKGKRRFGAFKARIGKKCMFLHQISLGHLWLWFILGGPPWPPARCC